VGLAFYPDDAQSAAELLACSDRAMYRMKRSAREDVAMFSEQTSEMAALDEDPDQAVARRITQGKLIATVQPLFGTRGSPGNLHELEPALARPRAAVDACALRRVAATEALAMALHGNLLSAAVERVARHGERVLVTVSQAFCMADGAPRLVTEAVASCAPRLLCIGLPQEWLRRAHDDARRFIESITAAGGDVYVADFGADGADLLLLSRLPALRGLCLDGALLRELSVDPSHAHAFVAALAQCAAALSMDCLVRASDRELIAL
jgi:predicted signal transduction protein with EAL and GGDEF domain